MADDAMDVDQSSAPPRSWRVVRGAGRVCMAKVPPVATCTALFDGAAKGALVEELESDVSEDEEDPNAVQVPPWLRKKQRWRGRRREKQHRWRTTGGGQALVGTREGGQASTYVLLRETAPGRLEATVVDSWFNFRPVSSHETLNQEQVEKALKNDNVRYDVGAAAKLQPWRMKRDAERAESAGLPAAPARAPSAALSRLAAKMAGPEDEKPKKRGGGGGGGRRGGGAGQGDLFREEGAEAAAFGLSASGAEVEQAEMNEGMGDDLDFEEDFQDDEADEEKNQFEGMDFHDDAMSDDEGDDGKDDKDDKAQKEQAELDKAKAPVKRNEAVETKRWREAEHEEAKARPEKRAKTEETKGWDGPDKGATPWAGPSKGATPWAGPAAPAAAAAPAAVGPTLLTADEVRALIASRGGRMKTKDLLVKYKKRLKDTPANKELLKGILKAIADIVEDPADGRVLVLK